MYRFVLIAALFFFQISCKEKEVAYTPTLKKGVEDLTKDGIIRHVVDSIYVATFENDSLTSFYKMNGFKTVWNTSQARQLIIEELSKADQEGLDPKDYNLNDLDRNEKKFLL